MEESGISAELLDKELKSRLNRDFTFDSGKILGSMCTRPHPVAIEVFTRYIEKNVGDPGLVYSTVQLEKEAVGMLASLFSLDKGNGYIVTGGTEANILALWTARAAAKNRKGTGEVIVPESAHFSFDKAANLLGLKLRKIGLDNGFRVDISKVKKAITSKTIALVGIAGTTSLGAVDPLKELSDLAIEHNLYLHIDGAFGGYVIPFLRELGFPSPQFDFRLKGVSSITVDPHKMGMAVIPAGCIIYRNPELAKAVRVEVPYLSGGENAHATIVGTRSGASVVAVWSLLRHLGKLGYRTIVRRCMDLTHFMVKKLHEMDNIDVMMEPVINVIGITSKTFPVQEIAKRLREKGWAISLFTTHIRIVIMPHVYQDHIESFLDDLKIVLSDLKAGE